jgi:uncharacterized protein YggE
MWPSQQALESPFGVSVFGSAVLRTEPDFALVELAVRRIAPSATSAFDATRKGVAAVRSSLQRSGVPDDAVEVSRVAIGSVFDGHGPSATFKGYQADVGFRIVLEPLDGLEGTLSDAVEAGANVVHRVRYRTRRLRELREQVRREAVGAARRKAEIYCEAAGVRLGTVIHIEDVNPDQVNSRGGYGEGLILSAGDEVEEGGLSSGSLEIAAAVLLGFQLLED